VKLIALTGSIIWLLAALLFGGDPSTPVICATIWGAAYAVMLGAEEDERDDD
jgi:hypothetical protein